MSKEIRQNKNVKLILIAVLLAASAILVYATGTKPYFTPSPPSIITCYQNSECFYDFNATDDESDPVNFTIDTPPFSAHINPDTGIFNFTPNNEQVDTYPYTWVIVKETDTGNGSFALITWNIINVNDAPNITSHYPENITNITEKEGYWLLFNITADDPDLMHNDTLNYTWMIDGQINLTLLNYTYGAMWSMANYTPDYRSNGTHYITVNVSDNQSAFASITWEVNITNENRAPILVVNISNITMVEDTPSFNVVDMDGSFYDLDLDDYPITYDVVQAGLNMTIIIDPLVPNNVSIFPDTNFFGITVINFRAFDGYNYTLSNNVTINVTGTPDPPVVQQVENATAYAESSYTLQIHASDPDYDTLTYYNNHTELFTINPTTGFISFTSLTSQIGNYSIEINASDGLFNTSMIFNLSIINNSAPVIGGKPLQDIYTTEGNYTYIEINATDADPGDTLAFDSYTNKPTNPEELEIITTNDSGTNGRGYIAFTPDQSDIGSWSVTINVTDSKGSYDTATFTIHVIDVEHPPVLQTIPNQRMKINLTFTLNIFASDEDGNLQAFDANTTLFSIIKSGNGYNATGLINFTPNDTDFGEHWINISINDSSENYDWQIVLFNVTYNTPPTLELIPDQNGTEDSPFAYQINASDEDPQDTLTYYSNTTMFNITSSGLINFTPTINHTGEHIINVTVSDGEVNVSTLMNLTIGSYNDYPIWIPPLNDYHINWSKRLNTTYWNSTNIFEIETNATVWNATIYQNNYTHILLDAFDEEYDTNEFGPENTLDFYLEFINFTNASNNTITENITLFDIMNYDGNTGQINFTANNSQVGEYYVNITVDDTTGRENTTEVYLKVYNVNDAPLIADYNPKPQDYQNMTENSTMLFSVNAIDIDYGDILRYQWAVNGSNKTGANQTSYNYTTDFYSAGWKNVTVYVIDTSNATTIFNWTINVSNVNRIGWFGEIREYNYTHFNAGVTKSNITVLSGENGITLYSSGTDYRPTGIFESQVLDSKETNYMHEFTTISWTGNTTPPSGTQFDISFQTKTAEGVTQTTCPSTITSNYTDTYTSSGSDITSEDERCIQYKISLNTSNTSYTPSINYVLIKYKIANKEQEQRTNQTWIDLDTYFYEPDLDDNITYNVTDANGTNVTAVNITIDATSHKIYVNTQESSPGTVQLVFHMFDGYNSTDSNIINLTVIEIPPQVTPIIIPVGGGSVAQPVPKEVPKYVSTPVSFRLITPQVVTTYSNNTMLIPINIANSNFTMKNVKLKASSPNPGVTLRLTKEYFDLIEPNRIEMITLTAESFKTYGTYEILVEATAEATSEAEDGTEKTSDFKERAKIFINSLLKAEKNDSQANTKLSFAEDLLTNNPECLELNEFLKKAQALMTENSISQANKMLDQVIESCKYLIAPKEAKPRIETPTRVYGMPTESLFLLATVSIVTIIVAIALVIGWAHMKSRRSEMQRRKQ